MNQLILAFVVVVVIVIGVFGIGFVRQPEYRRLSAGAYLKMRLRSVADAGGNLLDRDRGRSERLIRSLGSAVLAKSAKTSAGSFTLPGSVTVFAGVSDYGHLSGPEGESIVRAVNQELAELPDVVGASQMTFQRDDVLSPGQIRVSAAGEMESMVSSGAIGVVAGPSGTDERATDVLVEEAPTKVDRNPHLAGGSHEPASEAPTRVDPAMPGAADADAGEEPIVGHRVTSHLEAASPQVLALSPDAESGAGSSAQVQNDGVSNRGDSDDGVVKEPQYLEWGGSDEDEGEDTEQPGTVETDNSGSDSSGSNSARSNSAGSGATAATLSKSDIPDSTRREESAQPQSSGKDTPETTESTQTNTSNSGDLGKSGFAAESCNNTIDDSPATMAPLARDAAAGTSGVVPATEAVPVVTNTQGTAATFNGPHTVPLRRCSLVGPDGQAYALSGGGLVIGRSPDCDVVIQDVHASARHARFTMTAQGVRVEDLGATNGVLVNHRIVHGSAAVSPDDSVTIGQTIYRVESVGRVSGQ